MTRKVELTVYSFDELSEEAKKKAIDKWVESDDLPFLSEYLQETLETLLDKHGITYDELPKVYYSLSYSQGDGAMFEGAIRWKAWQLEVRQSGHYYHYNSKQFWNFESVKTGKDVPDDTYKQFNELYVSICRELEKAGYAHIDAEREPASIAEHLIATDYEFYADGTFYYENATN